ncbi:MAG0110 family membrane protein [Candidatus Mycoplasma pogonae]
MTYRQRYLGIVEKEQKTKLLSKTLMWFGFGVGILLLMSSLFVYLNLNDINFIIFSFGVKTSFAWQIIMWILFIILHSVIYWIVQSRNLKIPFAFMVLLYAVFIVMDAWFVGMQVTLYLLQDRSIWVLGIMVAIPLIAIGVSGFLGYLGIVNYGKLWPLISILSAAFIVMIIINIFVLQNWLILFIAIVGIALYILLAGFTFYSLQKEQERWVIIGENAEINEYDRKLINYSALAYGMVLFLTFVQLLKLLLSIRR